jgi:hypothetical protein
VLPDVERRTAGGERHNVIDGEVGGAVGRALEARAPFAVLDTPGAPEGVVTAVVGLPCVLEAAATRAAGDDTTDRARSTACTACVPGRV